MALTEYFRKRNFSNTPEPKVSRVVRALACAMSFTSMRLPASITTFAWSSTAR